MYEKYLQYEHPKENMSIARSVQGLSLQEGVVHECRKTNCFYWMESHIMGDKGKCNKYQKVLDIINKMMEEKYDA